MQGKLTPRPSGEMQREKLGCARSVRSLLLPHQSWPASERGVVSATYARVHAPVGAMVDPSQLMMNAKDLPAAEFVDYTFVFH